MCSNRKLTSIFLFFGFLLSHSELFSQRSESARNMRIKSQEINQKELKGGEWKLIRYSNTQFDKKGNTLSNVEYGIDSSFKSNEKTIYNSNYDPIAFVIFDQEGKQLKRTQTTYNHLAQKIEERYFNNQDKFISMTKFEYDQFGHKTLEIEYNDSEVETSRIQYEYNKYGSLVLKRIFENDKCIYEKKYVYQYY